MFIGKWRPTEWVSLLVGVALLAGVLSTAPSAIAVPQQAQPVAMSCKNYQSSDVTRIKLAGTKNNDSCVVAWITDCDLQVDVVINADVPADLKSFTWSRIIKQKGVNPVYSSTVNTTKYGYKRRYATFGISWLYPNIPGCHGNKLEHEWRATSTVTLRLKNGRTIRGTATHKALMKSDGATIL
jgi:hypothetical protein